MKQPQEKEQCGDIENHDYVSPSAQAKEECGEIEERVLFCPDCAHEEKGDKNDEAILEGIDFSDNGVVPKGIGDSIERDGKCGAQRKEGFVLGRENERKAFPD